MLPGRNQHFPLKHSPQLRLPLNLQAQINTRRIPPASMRGFRANMGTNPLNLATLTLQDCLCPSTLPDTYDPEKFHHKTNFLFNCKTKSSRKHNTYVTNFGTIRTVNASRTFSISASSVHKPHLFKGGHPSPKISYMVLICDLIFKVESMLRVFGHGF